MPELPEVETIARTLAPQVEGRYIYSFKLLARKTLQAGEELVSRLQAAEIKAVRRRAKLLLLDVVDRSASPLVVAFHLKMTGKVFVHPAGSPPEKHTKLILSLTESAGSDNVSGKMFFDDMRTFGYCRIMRPEDMKFWPFWNKLGLEPLEHGPEELAQRLFGRKGRIKNVLLDQTVICGIGNIYADEVLFRAGVRPDCKTEQLSLAKLVELSSYLQDILKESIEACGSSIRDYRDANGNAGAFQNTFNVYGRAGQECRHCSSVLVGTRVAGRGTVYCPSCQGS